MISFVIPAHNEQRFLGATLDSVHESARAFGRPYEVVVAADACSDATESIARERGAHVVAVENRQISKTRNAGANAARGEFLFFIDADTLANPQAVRACVEAMDTGAVGGGCVFRFDRRLPLWGHLLYWPCIAGARFVKLVGGCFLFCTRAAFDHVDGFDESTFAAEELVFLKALKRVGRVVIPRPTVVTSARKLQLVRPGEVIRLIARMALHGPSSFKSRDELDIFYGERSARARTEAPTPKM